MRDVHFPVLDTMETIKVCVAYECGGRTLDQVPANIRDLEQCRPVLESFPGWQASTREARTLTDLPPRARDYVAKLAEWTGVPVGILSVGPRRDSTMRLPPSLPAQSG